MPATEETYRSQPTLHLVFAITLDRDAAVDRLDDHGRPPPPLEGGPARVPARSRRQAQGRRGREAQGAEGASTRRRSTRSTPRSRRPRTSATQNASEIRELEQRDPEARAASSTSSTPEKRFKKAELDSQRSLYDGMIDRGEEPRGAALPRTRRSSPTEKELLELTEEFEDGRRRAQRGQGRARGPARPRRRPRRRSASS